MSVFYTSCSKDNVTPTENEILPEVVLTDGLIKLGKKLDNPYSVSNMKRAYQSLKEKNQLKSSIKEDEITTSHLYVRFLPSDSLEYSLLLNDTTLELFTYPLDYEIEEEGNYYQDPNVAEGSGTWLYTVVPTSYNFPEMQHELLEECFIPDEEAAEENSKSTDKSNFLADLETEAMRITGNLTEEELSEMENTKRWRRPSKEYPKGRIEVGEYDLINRGLTTERTVYTGLDGVRGVKIRTHRVVKISSAWTTKTGNYQIPRGYRRKVHYSIIFKNSTGFKIWGNRAFLAPARYSMGWQSKYGHSREFYNNSKAWKWATINNAASKYRDHCSFFISKPPTNLRIWVTEMNSGIAMGSTPMIRRTWGLFGFTTHSQLNNFFYKANGISLGTNVVVTLLKFLQPDITLSINTSRVSTADVYRLTFHECAHASHWTRAGNQYWVREINYFITYGLFDPDSPGVFDGNAYGDGTGANAGYCGVTEMWANYIAALFERKEFITQAPYNTTAMADAWDWFEPNETWFNPGFLKDVDNIPDITTYEIFSCLTSSTTTFDELISQLKTKTTHDAQIDAAFASYTDWP